MRVAIFAGACFESACSAVTAARGLAAAGHEPTLVGDPRWLESSVLVGRAEFSLWPTQPQPIPALLDGRSAGNAAVAMAGAIVEDGQALRAIEPERVVAVAWPPGLVAAAQYFIPSVSIAGAGRFPQLFELDPLASRERDIIEGAHRPRRREAHELEIQPSESMMDRYRRLAAAGVRDVVEAQGLTAPRWVDELYRGDRATLLTGLFAPASPLGDGLAWGGAVLADIAAAPPLELAVARPAPIAYVELEERELPLVARLCDGLARAGILPLVAARDARIEAKRAVIARHVDHAHAIDAASLIICHGQSALVARALAAGKPVVALPDRLDRAIESVHAARRSALRVLPRGEVELGRIALAEVVAADISTDPAEPPPSAAVTQLVDLLD